VTAILTPDRIPVWSEKTFLVLWTEYFHLATPFDEGNCSSYALLEPSTVDLEKCQPEEWRLQGEFPDELVVGFYGEYGWERDLAATLS
jgi:hypothetical protein